jgi:hypothetical protein
MMIDENLIFITLVIVFFIFFVNKYQKLVGTLIIIIIVYIIYKKNFTNPRDFINYMKTTITEGFEPCSFNNQVYCGTDYNKSNMTLLPDYIRGAIPSNDIKTFEIRPEDYQIDKRTKMGLKDISVEEMISEIPALLDYKIYLEKIIKFVLTIKTDDPIQKDFLAKKLRHKMSLIIYNAYNTINEKVYPINTYNELIFSQRDFISVLDTFAFLGLTDYNMNKLKEFEKEFKLISDKVNSFVIEKVNNITPNDYNITTSFLPNIDEPLGINALETIGTYNYKMSMKI